MGRPTDNPKNVSIKFKADDETVQKLKECSQKMEVSQAEILRRGVHRIHGDLKRNKRKRRRLNRPLSRRQEKNKN